MIKPLMTVSVSLADAMLDTIKNATVTFAAKEISAYDDTVIVPQDVEVNTGDSGITSVKLAANRSYIVNAGIEGRRLFPTAIEIFLPYNSNNPNITLASLLNADVTDMTDVMKVRPHAEAQLSKQYPITTAWTKVPLDKVVTGTNQTSCFDPASGVFTIPSGGSGIFRLDEYVAFNRVNANVILRTAIYLNGKLYEMLTDYNMSNQSGAQNEEHHGINIHLNEGDEITYWVKSTQTGTSLLGAVSGNLITELSLMWLRDK